jgi:Tfp pilus assembly protein PilO
VKRLARHKAALIAGAAVLLVAVAGWLVVVSPQRSKSAKLADQIEETQNALTAARLAARPTNARPTVRVEDLYRLGSAMPTKVDMPGILIELSRVAGRAGVTLQTVTPRTKADGIGYRYLPVDLMFQGTYYELSEFLYQVRNLVNVHRGRLWASGRLFTVDGFDFTEGEKKFPYLQATLTVNAYLYDSEAGAVVPVAAGETGTGTDTTATTTATTTTSVSPPPAPPAQATAAGVVP